jgi:LacI family transcriptional regulator
MLPPSDPVAAADGAPVRRGTSSLRRWPKKVTIIDVAREANVSIKTVSRVLNREKHVSNEKRTIVQGVIDALGFIPSASARALPGGRFYTIGILLEKLGGTYLLDIQLAVMRECQELGYHVIVEEFPRLAGATPRSMRKAVAALPIDGAILLPPASDNEMLLDALDAEHVIYTRMAPAENLARSFAVTMDDEGATRAMVRLLANLGHTRIGFIAGKIGHGAAHRRLNAFRAAIGEFPIDPADVDIRQGDFSFEAGQEQGGALLDSARPPTAIFASNDVMAAGVVAAAGKRGLSVPHDLTVCGFDDSALSRHIWPPLTTIRQPLSDMATLAARQMLRPNDAERIASLPFELIIRGSSAPPKRQ